MKLILAAILIVTLVSPLALSVQASSNHAGDPVIPVYTSTRPTDQENVLIFLDNLPWGFSTIQTLLDSLGATYTEAASSEMATIDMDPFDVIILASQQPSGFYREFQAQSARFEDYLYSGGVLEFHCATLEMSFWEPLTLPGGVTHEVEENHYNFKVNENHPILAGLPDTLHGSFASHEHFWNLPPGTDVITIDEVDLPTTIEYGFGAGTVLATGMAWEFNYNFGYTSGGCLPNAIAYALSISGGSAVAIDLLPFNPPIQIPVGGGSFDYNITVMKSCCRTAAPSGLYSDPSACPCLRVFQVIGTGLRSCLPEHLPVCMHSRPGWGFILQIPGITMLSLSKNWASRIPVLASGIGVTVARNLIRMT
jgi:hypothetical protein